MSQRQVRKRSAMQRLARRYGLSHGLAAVLGCGALAIVLGMAFVLGGSGDGRLEIDRSPDATSGAAAEAGQSVEGVAKSGGEDDARQLQASDGGVTTVVVHVDGAVEAPGVYAIAVGQPRINDAVAAAGGLRQDADTSSINLAAPLEDGVKVHIPCEGDESGTPDDADGSGDATADSQTTGGASSGGLVNGGLVNINTADATALQTLSGVGEATAQAIIEDREQQGPFASPEDIMRVSGIGEKKYAKIRDHICV